MHPLTIANLIVNAGAVGAVVWAFCRNDERGMFAAYLLCVLAWVLLFAVTLSAT